MNRHSVINSIRTARRIVLLFELKTISSLNHEVGHTGHRYCNRGWHKIGLVLGSPAIDFSLPSTSETVELAQLRGTPFVLSFFSMAFTPV